MDMNRHNLMAVVFVALCLFCGVTAKKGGGGGGGAGLDGNTFGTRGGSRLSSSYIKSVPEKVYERIYTQEYNTYYYTYYNMYFNYSGTPSYMTRPTPKTYKIWVCANYEATAEGDVMGIFTCPNTWEPETFRMCCGADYAEFCCEVPDPNGTIKSQSQSRVTLMGVMVAILVLGFVYKIQRYV